MTMCTEIQTQVSAFADGDLDPAERATVQAHLDACAACRGVLRDLEQLRSTARHLGGLTPPPHVWMEIAGRIRLDAPPPAAAEPRASRTALWQWTALAAVLLLVTLGVYLVRRIPASPSVPGAAAGNAPAIGSVQTLAEELDQALAHYDRAIAELEAMAQDTDSSVDPAVAATIRRNLTAIDGAIAESRAALAANPQSASARDSLVDALMQKVNVLQATVSLVNEMRRGNSEGAARAAENLGKKS
jgi:hypothetical protein